jgi:hypothetical protein
MMPGRGRYEISYQFVGSRHIVHIPYLGCPKLEERLFNSTSPVPAHFPYPRKA